MNIKNIALLNIGVITLACSTSTDEHSINLNDTTQVIITDTISDTNDVMIFETFEDYAKLTSKSEVYKNFGEVNIVEDTSWYAEGELMLFSSVVTDPNNGYVIKYIWQEENPEQLEMIEAFLEIYDNNYNVLGTQKIASESGLFTGMTLNELQAWNGESIDFSGFGWDYGGSVFGKPGSKLAKCPLIINLGMEYDENAAEFDGLFGDIELNSNDKVVKSAPIFVRYMSFYPEKTQ